MLKKLKKPYFTENKKVVILDFKYLRYFGKWLDIKNDIIKVSITLNIKVNLFLKMYLFRARNGSKRFPDFLLQ